MFCDTKVCKYPVDKLKISIIKLYNNLVWSILCFIYYHTYRNSQAKLFNYIYLNTDSFEVVFLHTDGKFLLTLPIIYMV